MRKILLIAGMVFMATLFFRPLASWGADEESFVLDNGLKVILVRQAASPVVSMRVLIRTGAADENGRGEYGLAHLMEHMAFKGATRHPDPGEISSLIEGGGGDMNAYTSSDATVYHLTLPATSTRLGLDILSDMVFSPAYDPQEYKLEKEVVVEEIKRGRDNPDLVLLEDFFAAAYPGGHPYGRPVIGYEDTVRGATLEVAKAFHRAHYRPDNAVLVVTGGFDRAAVLAAVDEFYKPLPKPAAPLAKPAAPRLAPAAAPTVAVKESGDIALAKVFMGFRGPSGSDPEAPVMDLLSSVLTGGKSSRLTEVVKDQKGLVTDISTSAYSPRYEGSFMIAMETEPAKVIPAIEAVWQELEKLGAQPPAEEELGRSRALAEKAFLAGAESAQGLASQIVDFEYMLGDWRLRDGYLPLWNRTSPAEVSAAAARAFTPANLALVVMLPAGGDQKGYPTEAQLAALAGRLSLPVAAEAAGAAPTFTETRLKAGPRLLTLRDATLPQVTVKAAALGGLLAEGPGQGGLCNLLAEAWGKATQDHSAAELSRAVENIGAAISGGSGRNSLFLTGSFLSADLAEGLKLFAEVLTRPAFQKDDVEQVRAEALAEIKAQDEQLAGRVFRLLAKTLYPAGHPYSRDQLGTAESVAGFGPADLEALYNGLVRPENLVITVAGDIEPDRVKADLEAALAGWRPKGEALKVAAPAAPSPLAAPQKAEEKLDRAQTHVALGFQVPGLGAADGPALEVLAGYLSGMSGPLFRELRDQQSLAYTVHCGYTQGLGTGSFSFYIATDPAKTAQALAGFRGIIERLRQKPISEGELEAARRYLIGTTQIRLQTVAARSTQAMLNSLYDLGLDYDERRLEAISRVTAEEVRAAALKYLDPGREALAMIGSEK